MFLLFFLIGVCLGSFGNVLILRLPAGKGIGGRSACPGCGRTLKIREIIPILSFFLLRGRCRTCHRKISRQYPVVELISGLIFLAALWNVHAIQYAILLALALWLLLLIAVMDMKFGVIADALTLPFIIIAAAYAAMNGIMIESLWAALLGAGFFGAQWLLSRGKWVGSGDILLAAGIGFLLGDIYLMAFSLWCAYIAGAIVAAILLARKKRMTKDTLSFSPFLALGAVISMLWGGEVLRLIGY